MHLHSSQPEANQAHQKPIPPDKSKAQVQMGRMEGLAQYSKEKAETMDHAKLVSLLSMGTDRILADLRKQITALESDEILPVEREFYSFAASEVDDSKAKTVELLRLAESKVSKMHEVLKEGKFRDYLAKFQDLNEGIQNIFHLLESENTELQKRLEKVAGPTFIKKALANMQQSVDVLKKACVQTAQMVESIVDVAALIAKESAKTAAVAVLTASVANASVVDSINQLRSTPKKETKIVLPALEIRAPEIAPQIVSPEIFEEIQVSRAREAFFQHFLDNPQNILLIGKFQERSQEVVNFLLKSPKYSLGDWKKLNMEVAKRLFPHQELSSAETEKIVRVLQKNLGVGNDGHFWPKTQKAFIARLGNVNKVHRLGKKQTVSEIRKLARDTANDVVSPELSPNVKAITRESTEFGRLILKQVSHEIFEERLLKYIGTKYIPGLTDCSGILRKVMKELWLINRSFRGNSGQIMKQLTSDRRKAKDVQAWDFLYWQSAHVQDKNQRAHHIAYVYSLEKQGIWIVDSSTDAKGTAKRFMPWRSMLRKKWITAGAAAVLVKDTLAKKMNESTSASL